MLDVSLFIFRIVDGTSNMRYSSLQQRTRVHRQSSRMSLEWE